MITLKNLADGTIEITYAAPDGATALSHIVRTDRNGSHPLRGLLETETGIVLDYEAGAGDVEYTVTWGGVTENAHIVNATLDSPILQRVLRPDNYQLLEAVETYQHERNSGVIVHDTPNVTHSVISYGTPKSRLISLTILSSSFAAARDIEALLIEGGALQMRQPEHAGLDFYFIAKSTTVAPFERDSAKTVWKIDVDAVEINLPPGIYQTDRFNSYQVDLETFPTYIESAIEQPTYLERMSFSA